MIFPTLLKSDSSCIASKHKTKHYVPGRQTLFYVSCRRYMSCRSYRACHMQAASFICPEKGNVSGRVYCIMEKNYLCPFPFRFLFGLVPAHIFTSCCSNGSAHAKEINLTKTHDFAVISPILQSTNCTVF